MKEGVEGLTDRDRGHGWIWKGVAPLETWRNTQGGLIQLDQGPSVRFLMFRLLPTHYSSSQKAEACVQVSLKVDVHEQQHGVHSHPSTRAPVCCHFSGAMGSEEPLGRGGPRPISVRAAAFSYQQRLRFVPLVILFQTDMGDLTAVIPALVRSGNLQTRRLLNLNFALRFFPV